MTPPWWELADARRVGQYYNWTLDELLHAARAGFDGICTNEHHQNAYGFMPSPNLMGSVLAKQTNDLDVAIVQMGMTLPTTSPPIRIAEEYAMLDCISGGRLVAGLPLGSPMDVNLAYGITPMEHRERYREAVELVTKAWQAKEIFAWNGKYFQLGTVNLWPRPIQQPYPPIWIPGSGSISTFDFAADRNACYCFLSYSGARSAKAMMDGYWRVVEEKGLEHNPYRAGFLQLVAVCRDGCAGGRPTTRGTSSTSITSACTCRRSGARLRATRTIAACWPPTAARCGAWRIPRRCATRTSWTRATSSRGARPPCASASSRK